MTAVKYPKDREKLDDFYKEWHEANKNDLADTWQRPEVYDFASKYAIKTLAELERVREAARAILDNWESGKMATTEPELMNNLKKALTPKSE